MFTKTDKLNFKIKKHIIKSFFKKYVLYNDNWDFVLRIFPLLKPNITFVDLWIHYFKKSCKLSRQKHINILYKCLFSNEIKKYVIFNQKDIEDLKHYSKKYHQDDYIIDNIDKLIINTNTEQIPVITRISSFCGIDKFNSLKRTCSKPILNYLQISPIEFANELTFICSQYYKNITSHNLLDVSLNEDYTKIYEITELIKLFEKIHYLIPKDILTTFDSSVQIKIINFFLDLSIELKNLRNYYMLYSVVLGIMKPYLQSLNNVWSNSEIKRKINIISPFIKIDRNSYNYRNELNKITVENTIPHLGIILSDIKHFSEINLFNYETKKISIAILKRLNDYLITIENYNYDYGIISNDNINKYIIKLRNTQDDIDIYDLYQVYKLQSSRPHFIGHKLGNTSTTKIFISNTFNDISSFSKFYNRKFNKLRKS
jgi:hypothetical protein